MTLHESLERHHFQLLLAFQQTGNLGRAADYLSISPSAASHRLKEAEKRLGVKLTEPMGRSLKLTRSGSRLAMAAAVAEDTLRAGEETSRWLGSTGTPTVRVALDFFDRAPWFYRHGGFGALPFRVDIVRVAYGTSAEAVERRVVDIGVAVVPGHASEGEVMAHDELAAAVPGDHPGVERGALLPEEVALTPYMTAGDRPEPGFEFERFLEPAGVYPAEMVMIESVSTILQLVAAGRGLTIQPRTALEPAFEGSAVIPLADVAIPVRWEALTRPERSPQTEMLLEVIAESSTTPPEIGDITLRTGRR